MHVDPGNGEDSHRCLVHLSIVVISPGYLHFDHLPSFSYPVAGNYRYNYQVSQFFRDSLALLNPLIFQSHLSNSLRRL